MPETNLLTQCFIDALALPVDIAPASLSYRSHPAWDSVAHMRLVAAIETAFNVMLSTEEILALSSLDEARTILTHHGHFFPA